MSCGCSVQTSDDRLGRPETEKFRNRDQHAGGLKDLGAAKTFMREFQPRIQRNSI